MINIDPRILSVINTKTRIDPEILSEIKTNFSLTAQDLSAAKNNEPICFLYRCHSLNQTPGFWEVDNNNWIIDIEITEAKKARATTAEIGLCAIIKRLIALMLLNMQAEYKPFAELTCELLEIDTDDLKQLISDITTTHKVQLSQALDAFNN